ncbi:hypothetical protein CS0771_43530 [Catellatospora sp. IY07-71]|nr:hypothetical protein CS0771_43530 [Catellatospora sp. IY07-71]
MLAGQAHGLRLVPPRLDQARPEHPVPIRPHRAHHDDADDDSGGGKFAAIHASSIRARRHVRGPENTLPGLDSGTIIVTLITR